MDKLQSPYVSLNKRAYDENADFYSNKYENGFMSLDMDFIGMIGAFAYLSGGIVLDLGAGNGVMARKLKDLDLDVICLDISKQMLKRNNEKNLLMASMQDIPLRSGSIDGVFANCSLLHLPRYELPSALLEIKRVLRKNGAFMLTMKLGPYGRYDSCEGFIEEDGIERFQAFYDEFNLFSIVSENFKVNNKLKKNRFFTLLCTARP